MIGWIIAKVGTLVYYGSWAAVVIFVAAVLLLFFCQNSLIYMPGRHFEPM